MKKSIPNTGRVKQKLQTRKDIFDAARALMREEKKITLEDVAKKANVSRATIYRYFSNIDLLFTEASLDIHHDLDQIYDGVEKMSFADRIFHLQKHYNQLAQEHELVFRRYLSSVLSESITSKESLRGARRVESLNKALEPYKEKLREDTLKKIINISSVLMGIDSIIICKDVCKLNNEETDDTLKWALEMILKGCALEEL